MLEQQISGRGIKDRRVLDAMGRVDRREFVPQGYKDMAYEDGPLPIGHGQTISQPYIVALMTEAILPSPEVEAKSVLEIGAGSGYQTAILCCIFQKVTSYELVPELAREARMHLNRAGFQNYEIHAEDGSRGHPGVEYQAILAAAAFSEYPVALERQLAPEGKMMLPAGRGDQFLYLTERRRDGMTRQRTIGVRFVPMLG